MEAWEFQKFSFKQTSKQTNCHKIYARAKLVLAWRTVRTVTSKPSNNNYKAYEVSGKELLHERQIDIILEMAIALKTKFMLRNKTPHDLFHKGSVCKWLQLVPPDNTTKLTLWAKLLIAKAKRLELNWQPATRNHRTRELLRLEGTSGGNSPAPSSKYN